MTALDSIRPTTQMVADLVRTRIVHEGGDMDPTRVDTFDSNTYPTLAQAERLIEQAANAIYIQLPGSIADAWAPAGQHLAALYAAILIEGSYFREQVTDDQVALYRDLLTSGIRGLGTATAGGGGEVASTEVDTVTMRSVMTLPWEQVYLLGLPELDV